ncbi:DUF3086 domain-containing protein [Lusitaniella coriacea LEGE 07157]|uniref:DUF3086 domain-containing protein n=1 Tax=Lusitaniella coriacea LEGE 07157 TaxID=945747 RepID=A0A8J7JCC0_9CYAN|nr:DUF3086 domain-containing protein [Lusitaniella coriacea]MBE9117330.1 DUF3086 domain-containing protein [Lusitaniella coriacea LEGE 07157]
MSPDESQTPEEKLEQAFIADSDGESQDLNIEGDAEEKESSDAPLEVEARLDPLPELRMDAPSQEDTTTSDEKPLDAIAPETTQEEPPTPDVEEEEEEDFAQQQDIAALSQQKQALEAEIQTLQAQKEQLLSQQTAEVQALLEQMVREGTRELEKRRKSLQGSIEQLERRRERIREEMRTSFAGVSQDMAIRVQGFKDYLVGSLQDLSAAAEQLELPAFEPPPRERPRDERRMPPQEETPSPRFAKQGFQEQRKQISSILDRYRTRPDYYGPPWQLRRTFEPIHAERVQNWFFSQGGRGAIRTMGSRLQNILIASSVIAVTHNLYPDRSRTLVLANTPERLGEWRRGLQDCLGISRGDFGPSRGITLFESPEALVQKAERLVDGKQLPLIIIDETEDRIDLSLLQFPLWLAFAPDPSQMSSYMY